jgi:histone chaperone ASF1
MASPITLGNVALSNNPSAFTDPIALQITFTAHRPLPSPLEWKIIYVGSARNE